MINENTYSENISTDINDIRDENSIRNQHSFDTIVYVDDPHQRLGVAVSMIANGYYCGPYATGGLKSLTRMMGLYNPYLEISYGQFMFGSLTHEYRPDDKQTFEEWSKYIEDQMVSFRTPIMDIALYYQDRDAFIKKYQGTGHMKPVINCGSNIKMFEYVTLLRDDDHILDSEERKKRGIYDNGRLFTNIHNGNIGYVSNLKDFDENHKLYEHYKITDIFDILGKFKLEHNYGKENRNS